MIKISSTAIPKRTADYPILKTGTDLGREQLECLDLLLDPYSHGSLTGAGIREGLNCLEIGAGSGSVARWMADRVRPGGRVLAIDIDPSRLTEGPGLVVRRHDINDGAPAEEAFDLIHARLVLMHLHRREEIVADLVDALKPGGRLILGEYFGPVYEPISARRPDDSQVFRRVMSSIIEDVGEPAGISYTWAHEIDAALASLGLIRIHTERHAESVAGGSTGCNLMANYVRQAADHLLKCGISNSELERFDQMMLEPEFRTWLFEFTSVHAEKPASPDG